MRPSRPAPSEDAAAAGPPEGDATVVPPRAAAVWPVHPRNLVGSKWSRMNPEARECHWVVVSFNKADGTVRMQAVLTRRDRVWPWRDLRDRSLWLPGWVSSLDGEETP